MSEGYDAFAQSIQSYDGRYEAASTSTYLLDAGLAVATRRITDVPYYGGPVRARDHALDTVFHLPGLGPVQAAVSLRTQKVGTTDWYMEGPRKTAVYYHAILHNANFGKGFEDFQARFVKDFDTKDNGAFVEIIGDAPPLRDSKGAIVYDRTTGKAVPDVNGPLAGPVRAIANLDSLRCTRTGDPEYPVVYEDIKGRRHKIHATRVWYTADMPSNDERRYGVGFCALSRAVSAAQQLFKWGEMANEMLDDFPSSGVLVIRQMAKALFDEQMKAYEKGRQMNEQDFYHGLITLFFQNKDGGVELVPFRQVWSSFDDRKFYDVLIDLTAMAWNMDRQELAPLATSSLGSGAQSGQLAKKSRGKGVHNTLLLLERFVNSLTPQSVTFHYDYTDEDQELQRAQIAQMKVNTILALYTAKNPDSNVNIDTVAVQTPAINGKVSEGIIDRDEARYWLVKDGVMPREFMTEGTNPYPDFQRFDAITTKALRLYGPRMVVDRAGRIREPLLFHALRAWRGAA